MWRPRSELYSDVNKATGQRKRIGKQEAFAWARGVVAVETGLLKGSSCGQREPEWEEPLAAGVLVDLCVYV